MKTKDLWMAIAALAVAGCSQNEITEINPEANPAVGFSVYTGTQTKGLVMDNSEPSASTTKALKDAGFGILASYTGQNNWSNTAPNFMYNQKVTWNSTLNGSSGDWEYTPLKYWSKTAGDKISFWGYAPYDDASSDQGIELSANSATTAPTITFTLKTTASDMVDLVAGSVMNKEKADKVSLTLKHVLSRVTFEAKVGEEIFSNSDDAKKTRIFITGAKLKGSEIYASGTYTFNTDASSPNDAWSSTSAGECDIISALNKGNHSGDIGSGTVYATSNVVEVTSTTAASIFAANQYLFLIPAGTSGVTGSNAQVEFTYDIVTEDAKVVNGYSKTSSTVTVDLTAGTLKKGTAYKYTFTFGVDAIKVEAAVDTNGWGTDSTGSEIDVPTTTP